MRPFFLAFDGLSALDFANAIKGWFHQILIVHADLWAFRSGVMAEHELRCDFLGIIQTITINDNNILLLTGGLHLDVFTVLERSVKVRGLIDVGQVYYFFYLYLWTLFLLLPNKAD
jgi:hypothetical protein